jgi:hypothetical protein
VPSPKKPNDVAKLLIARQQASQASVGAVVLTLATVLGSCAVSLGVLNTQQAGIVSAATTSAVAIAALIAHAIHSGRIEPSALGAAIGGFGAQVAVLAASFGAFGTRAGTIVSILSGVAIAAAQIAHALVSRKVP